jgi:hypothetical protein
MQVWVETPEVDGDRIIFRWTQSDDNPYQEENAFFFRYEGIDLAWYQAELFYEIFLALQLRVFTGYAGAVEVHFPTPVPAFSAAYWLAFHDAASVTISPIAETGSYSPWAGDPAPMERTRRAAVYYGGGKDSTLATCLLSELYGPDEVVLIQYIGPLRNTPKLTRFLEERQERMMLARARERLGVATQRVWTNYQAMFRKEGYRLRPHLELFTVGALPALLAHGVQVSTISWSWATYSVSQNGKGADVYHYARSRPEMLEMQSRHFAATLGVPLTVNNITFPFLALVAYWLIAERYPIALGNIVMCTLAKTDERWCYQCKKCWLFGLLGLSTGVFDPAFDYDRILTRSGSMDAILALAETGVEPTVYGNVAWIPEFANRKSFIMACHMVARIDLDDLTIPLSSEARGNLVLLKAMYGNRLFPEWEAISRVTLDVLGPDLGPKIERIVAEHFEIIDHLPEPWYAGGIPIDYPFTVRMPMSLDKLEHLQRQAGVEKLRAE